MNTILNDLGSFLLFVFAMALVCSAVLFGLSLLVGWLVKRRTHEADAYDNYNDDL